MRNFVRGRQLPPHAASREKCRFAWKAILLGELTDAVREQVLRVTKQIVDGLIHPYHGAAEIWALVTEPGRDYPDEYLPFVGLASEWQDQPDLRDAYEQDIRDEAAAFIRRDGQK